MHFNLKFWNICNQETTLHDVIQHLGILGGFRIAKHVHVTYSGVNSLPLVSTI